jgi:hypothetical protein
MRPSLANPESSGYRTFRGVPPQGAGRNAKHPGGLCKADRSSFVERREDHLPSRVAAMTANFALHPKAPSRIVNDSSSFAAKWP